jgi:hypothetical protein
MKLKTETPVSELKRALTHKNFYKNENGKHNSRYVFCGMYAFKGLVAEILYGWFPLEGTQLQHTLGNLFKNENLDRIFAYYDLDKLIRHGLEFDTSRHRHIFVFGLLGYLHVHAPEEVKKEFIRQHFILPYPHFFMSESKRQDLEAQCNVFSRMLYGKTLRIRSRQIENKHWQTTVSVNDSTLAEEESVSYRYSRTKTWKNALIVLSERLQQAYQQSENYELRQQWMEDIRQQKTEQEKEAKLATYTMKEAKKQAKRKAHKSKQAGQKQLLDVRRKQAKANAKKRMEDKEQEAKRLIAQMSSMSANKRRHLQDKQK